MKKHMSKGFSLIETIFSLFVFSLSMSLFLLYLPIIMRLTEFHIPIEEEIALKQLRELILFASDIEFNPNELSFYYMDDLVCLSLEKGRIVRKDGYIIYMDGLENSSFIKKENCIYLNYEKNGEKKKRFLGCKE